MQQLLMSPSRLPRRIARVIVNLGRHFAAFVEPPAQPGAGLSLSTNPYKGALHGDDIHSVGVTIVRAPRYTAAVTAWIDSIRPALNAPPATVDYARELHDQLAGYRSSHDVNQRNRWIATTCRTARERTLVGPADTPSGFRTLPPPPDERNSALVVTIAARASGRTVRQPYQVAARWDGYWEISDVVPPGGRLQLTTWWPGTKSAITIVVSVGVTLYGLIAAWRGGPGDIIARAGLAVDIGGVLLLSMAGLAQTTVFTAPMRPGGPIRMESLEPQREADRNTLRARYGFGIVITGFLLQLIAYGV